MNGSQPVSVSRANLAPVSWTKFSWTNAMVVALGAATSGDITVCTLPIKTKVRAAYIIIDTAATNLTTLTVSLGRYGALYEDYIYRCNLKEAAGTIFGDAPLERGGLWGDDLPSYTETTAIKAHFVSTGGNLSATLTCTGTVLLQTEMLP